MMEWNLLCKSKTGKRKVISKVTIMCLILTSFIMSFLGCATQNTNMEVIPMGAIDAHESIDLRGKTITTYIIYYTIEKLQQMHEGELLEVVTDNYEAIHTDIQAWTRMTGHLLKSTEKKEQYYIFYIEKSSHSKVDSQLAMVISSKGLTELLSPLGFALGAALEGIDVNLYFQGLA